MADAENTLVPVHFLIEAPEGVETGIKSYKPVMSGAPDKSKLYQYLAACDRDPKKTVPQAATNEPIAVTCLKCIATKEFVELLLQASPKSLDAGLQANIRRFCGDNKDKADKVINWLKAAYNAKTAAEEAEDIDLPDLAPAAQ